MAGDAAVRTFVLVSTDKAVAPATVMGASKALAEWAVEAADSRYPETRFSSVRFGNVLGSSGSVVPIFRRQIAAGGPVTVTDPSMTRYFMTIPEAVQLVIRAGSLSRGGEVFVLEMGEPVSILELAKDMIRLSGLRPGRDIAIEIVGPRQGEKLNEELFNPYEHPQPTPAQRILRADRPRIDPAWVEETFDRIGLLTLEGDPAGLAVGRGAAREPAAGARGGRRRDLLAGSRVCRRGHRLDWAPSVYGSPARVLDRGPSREVRRVRRHRSVLRPGCSLNAVLRPSEGGQATP